MANELLFLLQNLIIGSTTLLASRISAIALTSYIALMGVLANLFVLKQITLFNLTVTATDAFMIGAVFGLNLLQEYYGKRVAWQAIWIGFAASIFFAICAYLHLAFIPAPVDAMHTHYYVILHNTPRIILASLTAYAVSQTLEYLLYGWLKKRYSKEHILLRSNCSMIVAQLADTVIFSFAGLYGIVDNIFHIMLISYCVKLLAISLTAPFTLLSKKIMRHAHATV
jgi:uncharacterized integral membrane protein (TIGR00697 family)